MTNIAPNERIETLQVISLPDEDAIQWLTDNKLTEPPSWLADNHKHALISWCFSRRPSARVRLAVAQHGSHQKSLRRMFHDGTKAERLAVLSNVCVGPDEQTAFTPNRVVPSLDALEILRQPNSKEFAVMLSNPHIDRQWLSGVLKNWSTLEGLTDEAHYRLVNYLTENPIISAKYDDTYLDGYADYLHNELNVQLAELVQKVPVTPQWNTVITNLLPKLYIPYVPDCDVDLLEKWQNPRPMDDDTFDAYALTRQQIVRYLMARDHRDESRKRISLDHPDAAVRRALYCSLRPYELFPGVSFSDDFSYPHFEYLDEITLSDDQASVVSLCQQYFSRDKNAFVESLLENEHFWRESRERDLLRNISWNLAEDPNSYMDVPNMYRARAAYYAQEHPDWFRDDPDYDPPAEHSSDAQLKRVIEDLAELRESVISQSNDDSMAHRIALLESQASRLITLVWALIIGFSIYAYLTLK